MIDMGAEAILCIQRGWAIFPCNPKDKTPLTKHGLNDAKLDRTIVERWWRQWPRAMIGVRTGPESGFFAIDLDIDPEKKLNGIAAFEALKNGGELPETIITTTPRGGQHAWLRFCGHLPLPSGLQGSHWSSHACRKRW